MRHGFHAERGTLRFWYDATSLYSYHMAIGVRVAGVRSTFYLLNGDEGPTLRTRDHMKSLRGALNASTVTWCIVPFSAMYAAEIQHFDQLELVATTPDREVVVVAPCRRKACTAAEGPHTHERTTHFLGETLLRYGGAYYVCGLDRNDDPRRRRFYFCQLPNDRAPRSVDAALAMLRPRGLPRDVLRQGEWFLVPAPRKAFRAEMVIRGVKEVARSATEELRLGVPILTDLPTEQYDRLKNGGWTLRQRMDRHRATRMVCNGAVYVSGMLRDAAHGPLKLGDGKTWFRVVKNRAVGSWAATGDVD